ncbi:MAG: DUF4394 domain-containing protein [Phycisphaerae bacterium]
MRTFVTLGAVVLGASVAKAVDIWSVDGLGLFKFDSASPQNLTRYGAAGVGLMPGLDFASDGTLYGFSFGGLYAFNLQTGAATQIGPGNLDDEQVLDMSWDPTRNQMFVISASSSDEPHRLRTVNLSTGNTSVVGTLNIPVPALAFGFAVNAAGTRYLHDAEQGGMMRLNNSLQGTFLGPEGNSIGNLAGMTINWAGDGTWYHAGLNFDSGRQEIYRINELNGAGTFIGNIGGPDYEFNFGDIAINPIPEPTSIALLALGVLVLRRR